MSIFWKKDLPTLIIAVLGFTIVFEWFFPISQLSYIKTFLGMIATIITNATVLIGTIYAVTSEYDTVRRNRTIGQYFVSGSFFAMMLIMAIVCILYGGMNAGYNAEFRWYQYNIYQPQTSAMYAVMFLFETGALYRVCRARSMESTVIMVCGGLFILGSIPLFASYVPGIEPLAAFVTMGPSLGGTRPANITAAIGATIIGLRALLGREQTTMETR
jgi:hypothetical protein